VSLEQIKILKIYFYLLLTKLLYLLYCCIFIFKAPEYLTSDTESDDGLAKCGKIDSHTSTCTWARACVCVRACVRVRVCITAPHHDK